MISRRRLLLLTFGLAAASLSPRAWGEEGLDGSSKPGIAAKWPAEIHALLETRCLACHSTDEPQGGVDLSAAQSVGEIYRQGRTWNKALRVIRGHEMPPASEEAMPDDERERLSAWIEGALRSVDCTQQTEPGRVTIRRLNRVEYQNTLRDLLGLPVDAARDLPGDPAGNGFDNQGDTLFIPPVLLEKYLDTTKRILDLALADGAPGRSRLLGALPSDTLSVADAAQQTLSDFLPRAFRRPIVAAELAPRVQLVVSAVARGETYESGLKGALASTLLSPHFLFRVEQDQAPEGSTAPYPLTAHELATRLSYFLWSTMPDDELRRAADDQTLLQPAVLENQVTRMLADPKSIALAEDFAAQWFGFRDMRTHEMDIRRFGKFNGLRDDMYEESRAFFDALFRGNGRVLDILDCNYAFVNARLAKHYGLPDIDGDAIRQVPLDDRRRGGVLGMGSTLTVTSYPTRTSPILRGKWVLETLLGTPPPPPPPNVAAVSKDDAVKDGLTLRQRLEKHRAQASCSSCHAKMDPLGFGLENYDGIGEWREQDNGLPIDASATLPDGRDVQGPAGLKDALLARQDLFVRHLVEKMLTYALGRGVDYYDECTIREALNRLAQHEYRSHELVQAIVASYPFRYRQNAD